MLSPVFEFSLYCKFLWFCAYNRKIIIASLCALLLIERSYRFTLSRHTFSSNRHTIARVNESLKTVVCQQISLTFAVFGMTCIAFRSFWYHMDRYKIFCFDTSVLSKTLKITIVCVICTNMHFRAIHNLVHVPDIYKKLLLFAWALQAILRVRIA